MAKIELTLGIPSRVSLGRNQLREVANVVRRGIRASVVDKRLRSVEEVMPLKTITLGSTGNWISERRIVGTTQMVEIPVVDGFDLTSVSSALAVLAPIWLSSLGAEKGAPFNQLEVTSFAFVE